MRKWLIVLIFAILGAAAGVFYFARKQESLKPVKNVLLITIDTLRADHVGAYGYAPAQTPNMDRIAHQGAQFMNAIVTTPLTLPSHSSIMTGEYPFIHGVRDNGGFYLDEKSQTLAETLKSAGFRTGGFVSAFVLDRRWGISQGFDEYFDNFELSKFKMLSLDSVQRRGDETLEQALRWIGANKGSRFFAWIHFYDPHTPYDPPEPFKSSAMTRGIIGLYDGEISYTDHLVGQIQEFLEKNQLVDNTLLILTADHGESLGQHDESAHGFFIYDATVHVPLIIRFPGQDARKIPDQVRSIDLFSTICDAMGVKPPENIQSTSLLPLVRGKTLSSPLTAYSESYYPRFHYGWSELKALRTNEYKFIEAPRREFYRIPEDASEQRNLYAAETKKAAPFESQISTMLAKAGTIKAPQAIDDDSLEKLQALGYIGSATHSMDTPGSELPDPKDKIRLYNQIKIAQGFSAEGKLDDAFRSIKQVLASDNGILEAHEVLGVLYMKKQDFPAARESFQNALKIDPEYLSAIFSLARAYKEEGNLEAARAGFQRLIERDPRDSKPYVHLSEISIEEKKYDEALKYLNKVVDLDPNQAMSHSRLGACYLEMKEYESAMKQFAKALDLNSRLPNAHFNSALILEETGNLHDAVQYYQKELELYPEAYPAHFNLARIYRLLGNRQEERRELETCVQQKPDYGVAYLYLAKNLMDSGEDLQKVKDLVDTGLPKVQEKSQIPFGHFLLADIYNRMGKPREAMIHVQKARESQNKNDSE